MMSKCYESKFKFLGKAVYHLAASIHNSLKFLCILGTKKVVHRKKKD